MKLLLKLEEIFNELIWTFFRFLERHAPAPILRFFSYLKRKKKHVLTWIHISPALLKRHQGQKTKELKILMAKVDVKKEIQKYESKVKKISKKSSFKDSLSSFFNLIQKPFKGFSPEQSIMLITFSVASVIAGLAIYSQSQRIFSEEAKALRAPASVEAYEFDRPNYHQKPLKSVHVYGIRIPVYFPQTNELQTVTIDFNIILNNKIGRVFIERREFPLRDHLIHTLEPTLAKYALDNEGKDIIKERLAIEVQNFLNQHQIKSIVEDVHISYILAN